MGGGSYSVTNAVHTRMSNSYYDKSIHQTFTARNLNSAMSPAGVVLRESRDSEEHPNSVPIILGLDVTGSMGVIPGELIKDGLPTLMSAIIQKGIPDPQVLFVAIGDHECDRAPLQVAQFESSDELLDKWLVETWLEGGGGGNGGESYLLAWYFAAFHTATDAWDKRSQKGFLFTVGDEPNLRTLPGGAIKHIMASEQASTYTADELLAKAQEKYNVYHVHVLATLSGSREDVQKGWKKTLGENVIFAKTKEDVPILIANKIISVLINSQPESEDSKPVTDSPKPIL